MSKELNKTLKAVRKDLRGHYQNIADHCGVSRMTVSNVLNGKHNNPCVEKYASELRKKVIQEREQTIALKIKKLQYS